MHQFEPLFFKESAVFRIKLHTVTAGHILGDCSSACRGLKAHIVRRDVCQPYCFGGKLVRGRKELIFCFLAGVFASEDNALQDILYIVSEDVALLGAVPLAADCRKHLADLLICLSVKLFCKAQRVASTSIITLSILMSLCPPT